MKVYKKLGLLFVLWRMRFLNIRQVICKIASTWDLKFQDFSNFNFVGKLGQKIKYYKIRNFGTTQVNNIKLVSLKSDKKDLCKYIKSDSQLLIFKITLDYLYLGYLLLGPCWLTLLDSTCHLSQSTQGQITVLCLTGFLNHFCYLIDVTPVLCQAFNKFN